MADKSGFDLSLEAPGEPGYWNNLEQNNERIIAHYATLIGQKCTDGLASDLSAKIGRPVRLYGNRFVTADYRTERLNLDLDGDDVIRRLFFA